MHKVGSVVYKYLEAQYLVFKVRKQSHSTPVCSTDMIPSLFVEAVVVGRLGPEELNNFACALSDSVV